MFKNLMKAPIDENNITSDWIEDVFDSCVCGGKHCNVYTGFIEDGLVTCKYNDNFLYWQVDKFFNVNVNVSTVFSELKSRLRMYDEEGSNENLVTKTKIDEKKFCIEQEFFFSQD